MGGRSTREDKGRTVTKAGLGTKRLCPNCGTKYYDLDRSPIVCPRCGTLFETTNARARPQPAAKIVEEKQEEVVVAETAEIVSLEEADEETADSGKVIVETEGDEEEEVEVTVADDPFLEQQDEDDEDVGDMIGEVDEEEP